MKLYFHGVDSIGMAFAIRLLFFFRGLFAFALELSRLRSLVRLPKIDIAARIKSRSVRSRLLPSLFLSASIFANCSLINLTCQTHVDDVGRRWIGFRVMPAATATKDQREIVRLLYLQHGHKKASELSGFEYDTVRQWAHRGNWTSDVSQSVTKATVDRVQDVLQQRKHESRTLLSEYQVKALHEATAHDKPLSITRQVNDLASIHSKVWPEDQTKEANFSLNVLNLNMFSDTDGPTLDE